MQNKTKIFLGVLLLAVGGLVLVNNLGIFDPWGITPSLVWMYFWPALFLGLGITLIFDGNNTGGVIFTLIGLAMLANRVLDWSFWSTFWPLILIGIGISTLIGRDRKTSFNNSAKVSDEDSINDNVLFWGVEKSVKSKNFKGGEINTVFGGYKLDLREAKISKDGAVININCAFGGVEILVPDTCRVVTNGTGILGGWDPNIKSNDIKEPTLEIKGVATFGGVEIKG